MEAMLWGFVEQLRGTYRLAELGLISEEDWRNRVEADVGFYLSDPYSLAWWSIFGAPGGSFPEVLRKAIDDVIANDERSSYEYITGPQRLLKSAEE
jgi:hypothetical protein